MKGTGTMSAAVRQLDAVALTKELIQIESTDPGVMEGQLAVFIRELLSEMLTGLGSIKCAAAAPGRPVIRAELAGQTAQPALVFVSHMDTVPIGEGWSREPLGAAEEDGRIYGRGACDMKAGAACAILAFSRACERARSEGLPQRSIRLIFTVDEEADMLGAETVLALGWVGAQESVIATEPTDGKIQAAHKSRCWLSWRIHGKSAHASEPETGADAVSAMAYGIAEARRLIRQLKEDAFCGASKITFGLIRGGQHPYMVPAECQVTVDMRLVPPYGIDDARRLLEAASSAAAEQIPGISWDIEISGDRPAIPYAADSEGVRLMSEAARAVTGRVPDITVFPGYTDTAVIAQFTGNKNTLSFGPGSLVQAHKPDEYVTVDEIRRCEAIYTEAMMRMFG